MDNNHSVGLYKKLLKLYPRQYRERFGSEMLEVFRQWDEESSQEFAGRVRLWFIIMSELPINLVAEYRHRKDSMTTSTKQIVFVSALLLVPFLLVLGIAIIGNALGLPYNSEIGQLIASNRTLATLLIIIFPLIAGIMTFIPFVRQTWQAGSNAVSLTYIIQNWLLLTVLAVSVFAIVVIPFHDSGPCVRHFLASPNVHQFTTCVRTS